MDALEQINASGIFFSVVFYCKKSSVSLSFAAFVSVPQVYQTCRVHHDTDGHSEPNPIQFSSPNVAIPREEFCGGGGDVMEAREHLLTYFAAALQLHWC